MANNKENTVDFSEVYLLLFNPIFPQPECLVTLLGKHFVGPRMNIHRRHMTKSVSRNCRWGKVEHDRLYAPNPIIVRKTVTLGSEKRWDLWHKTALEAQRAPKPSPKPRAPKPSPVLEYTIFPLKKHMTVYANKSCAAEIFFSRLF